MSNPSYKQIQQEDQEDTPLRGDFHLEEEVSEPPPITWVVIMACFIGGLGPVVSWNSLYVSETYFSEKFGLTFLSIVGLLQNIPSLIVQIILVAGNQSGKTRRLGYKYPTIVGALAQNVVLGVSFYIVAATSDKDDGGALAFLLYGLVLINGSATGMSAGRYFSLAAEFPPQCIGYMVAGNAMGALLPTFLYFIFNFVYSEDEIYKMLLQVIYPIGLVFLNLQIISFFFLERTKLYQSVEEKNKQLDNENNHLESHPDGNFKAVDADGNVVVPEVPNFGLFSRHLKSAWFLSLGLALTMLISLSLLSIVAFVPCFQFGINLSFYLIASYNLGDLVGRQVANYVTLPNMVVYIIMGLRLLFIPLILAYIAHPFADSGDALILVIYFLLSCTNGFSLVVGSANSQKVCGFSVEDICPVVGSLSAVAMQLGLVLGVALSLLWAALVGPLQSAFSDDLSNGLQCM